MVILINHRFTATVAVALKPFIHFGIFKNLSYQVSITGFLQVKCQFQVDQFVIAELLLVTSKYSEQYLNCLYRYTVYSRARLVINQMRIPPGWPHSCGA